MTPDPREMKLPKWAQERIGEMRRRADLAWPCDPKPDPVAVMDDNGFATKGESQRDLTLWKTMVGFHNMSVSSVYINRNGYEQRGAGFGSRMCGAYYATEREAILAAWWEACEHSATAIHNLAQQYRELDK